MQQNHYGSQELKIDILQTAIVSAGLGFGSNIDSQLVGEKNCVVTPLLLSQEVIFLVPVKHFPMKMHEFVAP